MHIHDSDHKEMVQILRNAFVQNTTPLHELPQKLGMVRLLLLGKKCQAFLQEYDPHKKYPDAFYDIPYHPSAVSSLPL